MSPVAVAPTTVPATDEAPKVEAKAKAKKAVKKPAAKPAKKAAEKPDAEAKKDQADRARAKELDLGLIHFRVLRALKDAGDSDPMTYRDIEAKTGYYAPLAEILHTDRGGENSLFALGLARLGSSVTDKKGRDHIAFCISAKGRKLLEKQSKKG